MRIVWVLSLLHLASCEYCHYQEAKENKTDFLECQSLGTDPVEGISIIHLVFNTSIPVITKNLLSPFKNLKTLYITAANVKRVAAGALDGLDLIMIDFYHNKLQHIDNGTFTSKSLTFLDLSYNELETIQDFTFRGLTSLEWLSLNSNRIRIVQRKAFAHNRRIKALYLNYNQISHLNLTVFQPLSQLEFLDLSYNLLHRMESNMFSTQKKLQTLLLQHNKLQGFPKGLFNQTISLAFLDASANRIAELEADLFSHTKKLEVLKVNFNLISELNSTRLLKAAPTLREVHLYDNRWKCDHLGKIVEDFHRNRVFVVANAIPVSTSNVYGIECTNKTLEK